VAGAATYTWPDACLLRWPPYAVFATAGGILLALGVPMWLTAAITVRRAYNRDELATAGVFGLVRNPIYSAMIVLNLPGIALLTRSWPLLLMPLVAYTIFKLLIHREDEYLERRFGQAYLDYRARVNELIPLPRFWLRK
jgi:protein-S-isoprenylcysteine O-methyltransferase Ste14